MAESAEHAFLSEIVVEFLERAASTGLYSFLENDRKKFDFGCVLQRDWARPLIGQTLWKHVEGVDKDVRTLLADAEAEICIYIARDSVKSRNIFSEAIRDFRRSFQDARPHRLRAIWVPPDFDADSGEHIETVTKLVEDALARDVLLNVVLGNLSQENIRLFISSSGRVALDLAILHAIATRGFVNLTVLAAELEISARSLPERLVRLLGCGFLSQPAPEASYYYVPVRGRVFLELCHQVVTQEVSKSPELERILRLLGIGHASVDPANKGLDALRLRIRTAQEEFGLDFAAPNYHEFWKSEAWPPMATRPSELRSATPGN